MVLKYCWFSSTEESGIIINFVFFSLIPQNVSIGAWEEPDMGVNQSILPTSPTSVVGVATAGSGGTAGQQESPELTLEYWSPKGQSQKV